MTWTERHTDPKNIGRTVRQQGTRIVRTDTARSLAASAIGSGGVNVKDGASIEIEGGGGVSVGDGGSIVASYPSGIAAFSLGRNESGATEFVVQRDELLDDEPPNIFYLYHSQNLGIANIIMGQTNRAADGMWVYANQIVLDAATYGGSTYITHSTTSNTSPVCIINTNGSIQRSTSAAKYKQDIVDPDLDGIADAVLRMRPRLWRDRGEVEKAPDTEKRYLGFIAEEAGEAGLDILVYRDPDSGEVEGFSYAQVTAPLVALAQRQQRELDETRSLLTAALARIEALEAKSADL